MATAANGTTRPADAAALREQARALREQVKIKRYQAEIKLLESFVWDDRWEYRDPLPRRYDDQGGYSYYPYSTTNDRRRGDNWPLWNTWEELAEIRGLARHLADVNTYAIGALKGLAAYTLGEGYTYRVAPRGFKDAARAPEDVQQWARAAQSFVDQFLEENDWWRWEREFFRRSRRDGECFARYFCQDGRVYVRAVEPEQVIAPRDLAAANLAVAEFLRLQEPLCASVEDWSYGVLTRPGDVLAKLAYCVRWMDDQHDEIVPACDIDHLKLNVDLNIKRGLSDFFPTRDVLEAARKLLRNNTLGSSVRAAIAFIRQHDNATAAQVEGARNALDDYVFQRTTPAGNQKNIHDQRVEPGTVFDINKGQVFAGAPYDQGAQSHIAVGQAGLRAAAVRWNAPEWITSSDSSNNNFASSLTAESPFVLSTKMDQREYKEFFRRGPWRALEQAVRNGQLPPEALKALELQVEAPNPEARNRLESTQENQIKQAAGVLSIQTWSQQDGLDYDREQQSIQEHQDKYGQQGPPLPMPGQGDGGPGGLPGFESLLAEADGGGDDLGPLDERLDLMAEILGGIFGEDAVKLFDRGEDLPESLLLEWDSLDHPRGKNGRFVPKGSAEAVAAAKGHIAKALKGAKTADSHQAVAEHLGILTVKQLHDLKKEYNLKASAKLKAELVKKLAERLDRGRREPSEPAGPGKPAAGPDKKKAPAPAAGTPKRPPAGGPKAEVKPKQEPGAAPAAAPGPAAGDPGGALLALPSSRLAGAGFHDLVHYRAAVQRIAPGATRQEEDRLLVRLYQAGAVGLHVVNEQDDMTRAEREAQVYDDLGDGWGPRAMHSAFTVRDPDKVREVAAAWARERAAK